MRDDFVGNRHSTFQTQISSFMGSMNRGNHNS